jgi:hypothetical protein
VAERSRHPLLTLRNEIDRLFDEASSMSPFSMFLSGRLSNRQVFRAVQQRRDQAS